MTVGEETSQTEGIAVIGMAGRFPGARNVAQLWQNFRDGIEAVTTFTNEQLLLAGVDAESLGSPSYVKAGVLLEGVELFDARFFGISPREAEITDPQQRIFLECAWEALESAGYDSEQYAGRIGVFAGSGGSGYFVNNIATNPRLMRSLGSLQLGIAFEKDYLATRVSHKLNLRGPSLSVQTACSTSLVAVHVACQSLLSGESDLALAGGVSIRIPQLAGYMFQEGDIVSPDGHCRAFDALANGTAIGSGSAIVVLKRLSDAVKDGDHIHGVIRGSAINNDGAVKVGYTAPSVDGQAAVIAEAQALAGITADAVSYVEAHGTGTPLGDPIEIAALTKAFRASTQRKGFCAIGSAKTNFGHLAAAAGVTGLIKTLLALENRMLPPSLNFERPNPAIDFVNSPFYVQRTLSEWKPEAGPRVAGISSFGVGGTNAHAIVEEAPPSRISGESRSWHLLTVSAKTPTALEKATTNLAEWLKSNPGINLADVAYTFQVGRRSFAHRRALVARNSEEALGAVAARDSASVLCGVQEHSACPVAFMFPGQASQHVNMGWEMYSTEKDFRDTVDFCCEHLASHMGFDLRRLLYPPDDNAEEAGRQLGQTATTQPALFVLEYALAKLWIKWSIRPEAMIGHSIGEYVAACLAGVFNLEDALKLVAARGRLMQSLPAGSMLSVWMEEHALRQLLSEDLSLAVKNGPSMCVVAGPVGAIAALERLLTGQQVACRLLRTSHAFHSQMMEPIVSQFQSLFEGLELSPPKIPFISNVTGTWITGAQATDPGYWASHLRQTVCFGEGVDELLKTPRRILLEVGPGKMLTTITRQHLSKDSDHIVLPSFGNAKNSHCEVESMMMALGRLWIAGAHLNWPTFYASQRRLRLQMPTYPFERQRYWIDAEGADVVAVPQRADSTLDSDVEQAGSSEDGYVSPRTETERVLTGIWSDVLGVKRIGIRDNFFDLGGHSLMAVQLQARMKEKLGKRLPLVAFFQAPTVEKLAELLSESRDSDQASNVLTLISEGEGTPLFLFHDLTFAKGLAKQLEPTRPVYGIYSSFEVELRVWEQTGRVAISMEELAERCIVDLRRMQAQGPYILAGYCFGGVLALEVANQLRKQGEQVALVGLLDVHRRAAVKPTFVPKWVKRSAHHARHVLEQGPSYISKKLRETFKLKVVERSQWRQVVFTRAIAKGYKFKVYDGAVVCLRATIHPPGSGIDRATNGWGELMLGSFHLEDIQCTHDDLGKEPYVGEVARRLEKYMDELDVDAPQAGVNLSIAH